MSNIVIVNGGLDWSPYLPGHTAHHVRLEESRWLFDQGRLVILTHRGAIYPEGLIWRLGAVRPQRSHRHILELIRWSGVPCINDASVLLRCHSRLSMLNECKEAGLPVVSFDVAIQTQDLSRLAPTLPAVFKVGDHHAGQGKVLVKTQEQRAELEDLISVIDDFVTIEPYLRYEQDLRYLAVGEQLWVMSRRSHTWRANVDTSAYELLPVTSQPAQLRGWTQTLMEHLKADALGLDFLVMEDGQVVLLEVNETPGVRGFPDEVCWAMAQRLEAKLSGSS